MPCRCWLFPWWVSFLLANSFIFWIFSSQWFLPLVLRILVILNLLSSFFFLDWSLFSEKTFLEKKPFGLFLMKLSISRFVHFLCLMIRSDVHGFVHFLCYTRSDVHWKKKKQQFSFLLIPVMTILFSGCCKKFA